MNELSTCVLGSSSAGNATLIWSADTAILIDCGFTPGYITVQLRKLGLSISDLDAVFITHIHGDHVNEASLGKFFREHVPIYCPPEIETHLRRKFHSAATASRHELLRPVTAPEFVLDHFMVRSFKVPHDSDGGCFGYGISYGANGKTKTVSIATDIAFPTKAVVDQMANSDVIVLESNYDVEMLEKSTRPTWLKRRIREEGHLSNDQCSDTLLQIIEASKTLPQNITLAHISQECNTNALALECTEAALEWQGIRDISVTATHPDRPGHAIAV